MLLDGRPRRKRGGRRLNSGRPRKAMAAPAREEAPAPEQRSRRRSTAGAQRPEPVREEGGSG